MAAGSYLEPQPEEVWLAAGSAARVFQDRAVYLHGDAASFVQHFGALLQHAGLAQAAFSSVPLLLEDSHKAAPFQPDRVHARYLSWLRVGLGLGMLGVREPVHALVACRYPAPGFSWWMGLLQAHALCVGPHAALPINSLRS